MEDRDWLLLQVLHEKKNITKTGQDLFISQPAVTARIQKIEDEFGIKIVYRGNKGVHFTPQGEYLAKFARETLINLRKAKEHLTNMDQNVAGTLRIGASKYFTKFKLPQILRLFKNNCPGVEFKVITAWSHDVFNLVNSQEVHVGFVRGDYSWLGEKHLLFEESMVIVSVSELNLRDLPAQPRIAYRTDAMSKASIDNWWRQNYTTPPLISMEVDTVDTCKEMVLNGLGYAIMPGMIWQGIADIHKVVITDKNGSPIIRKTWLVYQEELLEMNTVRSFVEFVKSLKLESTL